MAGSRCAVQDRKSVVSGKRGDLGDWSSDVCSSDLGRKTLRDARERDGEHRRSVRSVDLAEPWLVADALYKIGRASCRERGEISVTGVQTCALPISVERLCAMRVSATVNTVAVSEASILPNHGW